MTDGTLEEGFDGRMQRVQDGAKGAIKRRMQEREHAIITRCVAAYKANKIDANQLYGMIATIAELRSIAIEVEHDQIAAQREIDNLTKGN